MTLLLKTTFDENGIKLNAEKINLSFKNDDLINVKEFAEFADLEKTGIFSIKIHPYEAKRWYDSLPKDAQEANYIIIWTGGWISIPGKTVKFFSIER